MKLRAILSNSLARFTDWLAFRAWNHAKRREAYRWTPGAVSHKDWTYDQQRIRGNEAAQLLENRHYVEAFDSLNAALDANILGCNLYAKDADAAAVRLVMAKQMLLGVKRELERKIVDGVMADDHLARELASRERVRVFRR